MAKPFKSQWEFGELFPKEPSRKTLSVTELTRQIKRLLEGQVGQVWVTGEITNLRSQSSGHIYFTLKDAGAQVSCVLFRGEFKIDRSLLQDGRKVVLQGELTVYEPRGQYQLRVTAVELEGIGALQAAFEKLKQKLNAEGLFAPERKRPLPRYPQHIGLVTSPTGAAIRDVLHVIQRRNPSLQLVLAPCRVQGDGAAPEIARAIRLLNDLSQTQAPLDLILITRGGGSLEDLWAFNEEVVARAIFDSALPVVSAIGHEIDFTISDFVADLRAATPSVAAEILTEGVFSSLQFFAQTGARLRQLLRQRMDDKEYQLTQVTQRLARVHPRRRLDDWLQRLDEAQARLQRYARQGLRQRHLAWQTLAGRLARVRPAFVLRQRRDVLQQATLRLREQARHHVHELRNHLDSLDARLRLLGPEQVLARGYSITFDARTGAVLRNATGIQPGQQLKSRLQTGVALSVAKGQTEPG
jgi:exodeoxyribonuclease VII large subunit